MNEIQLVTKHHLDHWYYCILFRVTEENIGKLLKVKFVDNISYHTNGTYEIMMVNGNYCNFVIGDFLLIEENNISITHPLADYNRVPMNKMEMSRFFRDIEEIKKEVKTDLISW